MDILETPLTGAVQGVLLTPEQRGNLGVLVVTGSSGRVDVARARLFADRGAVALAQRWWGGDGQAPSINEIPIERFVAAIDRLRDAGCERLAMIGVSYGAHAALLTAIHDPRLELVVAISPAMWSGNR